MAFSKLGAFSDGKRNAVPRLEANISGWGTERNEPADMGVEKSWAELAPRACHVTSTPLEPLEAIEISLRGERSQNLLPSVAFLSTLARWKSGGSSGTTVRAGSGCNIQYCC